MVFQDKLDSKTSEELLAEYKKTKDQRIKQELVLRYIYIVKNIAIQMRGVYISFAQVDDIINEGVLALMSSIEKYDIEKNVKFETYISKRIRGLIIDIARRQDWVPRSVRKSAKDIDNATNILFSELGRFPTDKEIADYLHISLEKYQEDLGKTNLFNLLSLEMLLEDSGGNRKSNQLLNTNPDFMPEQHLESSEFELALKKGLETLRKNEQMVVSLYYRKELSMKEIASILGLSEPRISQIHANAIRKLKIYMENFINNTGYYS